jgi:putative sterol carrier protein
VSDIAQISSCQEYFDTLPARFVSSAAAGVKAVYQFDMSGDGGGVWNIVIDDGNLEINNGAHENPDATIAAKAENYVKIANGQMNGLRAVMTRKMKISGNLTLARKMQAMLPVGKP